MDATAISLCRENKLPIVVFNSFGTRKFKESHFRREKLNYRCSGVRRRRKYMTTGKEVIQECESKMKKLWKRQKKNCPFVPEEQVLCWILLKVEQYGSEMPLNQVATVSAPVVRLLVIDPCGIKTMIPKIEKAILAANLGE